MPWTLLLVAVVVASAQSSHPVAGTWVAEHAGTTFVRLELRATSGGVEGKIALGDIELDAQGSVKTASPAPKELKPIFDVTLSDSTVAFALKDEHDVDHFQLKRSGSGLELHFLLNDAHRQELASIGIATFKPILLKRVEP